MIFNRDDIRLAASKAGHDKGEVFVIVGGKDEYVFLADGKSRTVGNPKRKNKKHIQIIKKIPEDVIEVLAAGNLPDDLAVKRALKLYEKAREASAGGTRVMDRGEAQKSMHEDRDCRMNRIKGEE